MFIILAHQRSGTHLLASLLNSHPDLRCYDEVLLKSKNKTPLGVKNITKLQKNEGCIVMYSQFIRQEKTDKDFPGLINRAKIIHLKRINRQKHLKSLFKKRGAEYVEDYANKVSRYIDLLEKKVFRHNFDHVYEITYTEICHDKNISEYRNDNLLRFLGVRPIKLTTGFKKGEI